MLGIRKKILRAFKLLGFKIEIMYNLKVVNLLDMTFNLSENSFIPFHWDKQPTYNNNVNSNLPRSMYRLIPNAVNIRINWLSSNKNILYENDKVYGDALERVDLIKD